MPGPQGERGLPGERGLRGPAPEHEWIETSLRFRQRDETWGPLVDLKGPPGDPGEIREVPVFSPPGQSFGSSGGGGGGGSNVFIQPDMPSTHLQKYLWIQTGLGDSGEDLTFWVAYP